MYRAPLRDSRFVLEELLNSGTLAACPAFADYSGELAESVLRKRRASPKRSWSP